MTFHTFTPSWHVMQLQFAVFGFRYNVDISVIIFTQLQLLFPFDVDPFN